MPGFERSIVEDWFEDRGFKVVVSDHDYSEDIRRSRWRRRAGLTNNDHVWVDLMTANGALAHPAYGSGSTPDQAMERARERYEQEQEGTL